MNRRLAALATALAGSLLVPGTPQLMADEPAALYAQDFSKLPAGELPDEFLVLSGLPAVKEDGGNKFAEMPGAPLEDFGFLFGPSESSGVEVAARIFGTKQGRRFPTFAAGVNGAAGFKIRIAPGKKAIELVKGEDVVKSVPFEWKSGEWTSLKLRLRKADGGFKVEGKAWQGATEPSEWTIATDEKEVLPAGKCGVWGLPFSGTPIRFDDLRVTRVQP